MSSEGSKYIPILVLLAVPIGYALLPSDPLRPGTDPDLGQLTRNGEVAAAPTPAASVNLSSLERCGCKLADATNYYQPDGCRLKDTPNLVGVEGYLKTGDREIDKRPPPWRVRELKQTGPQKWDDYLGQRTAKTRVRVADVQLDGPFSPMKGRVQVQPIDGNSPGQAFWIDLKDFDPVPWWQCPADKAVQHSAILGHPKPGARPVTLEGRWITKSAPDRLWCWTWVSGVGVYCDPAPRSGGKSFDPWIYKPADLEIAY